MKLSAKMMEKLKDHAKEHNMTMSSKHIKMMKKMMEDGMSFSKAHREAMKMDKKDNDSKSKPMKGLTEKQKKLPKKLQEAIMKKKNKM